MADRRRVVVERGLRKWQQDRVTVIFLYDPVRIVPGELLSQLMRPSLPLDPEARPVRQIIATDDLPESVRRSYGSVRGSVFIIATDGTIAYRRPTPEPREWRRVLDRLLDREPGSAGGVDFGGEIRPRRDRREGRT